MAHDVSYLPALHKNKKISCVGGTVPYFMELLRSWCRGGGGWDGEISIKYYEAVLSRETPPPTHPGSTFGA